MKTYIVDSFTTEAFKGNPAAVCFPAQKLSEDSMLQIAKEFGLSETAFVHATGKPGLYSIRYFSPKKEIPLCGHATLASAKVLFKGAAVNKIHFITGGNVDLFIQRRNNAIAMEFPVYDTVAATVPDVLLHALGLERAHVANTRYSTKNEIILLEISDDILLAKLQPDFIALVNSYTDINGVLVTAQSGNNKYDFQYPYFWPWSGTNEDPVTGGVQTFLAKYWSDKLGKKTLNAFQCSARTGFMQLEVQQEKVLLISEAVIIVEGDFVVFD